MKPHGGTGVRELTRGLATLPKRWIQEPLLVSLETRMEDPPRGPTGSALLQCFCVCSGSTVLGDLLGVSRSRERFGLVVIMIS